VAALNNPTGAQFYLRNTKITGFLGAENSSVPPWATTGEGTWPRITNALGYDAFWTGCPLQWKYALPEFDISGMDTAAKIPPGYSIGDDGNLTVSNSSGTTDKYSWESVRSQCVGFLMIAESLGISFPGVSTILMTATQHRIATMLTSKIQNTNKNDTLQYNGTINFNDTPTGQPGFWVYDSSGISPLVKTLVGPWSTLEYSSTGTWSVDMGMRQKPSMVLGRVLGMLGY
jgi:hypothetical protein